MRDLIAIALGLRPPPWIQVRTIVGTVAVEDGKYVYSGIFTAQAEFTPKVITNDPAPVKVRLRRRAAPRADWSFARRLRVSSSYRVTMSVLARIV